jgi:hypothetical protein
VRLSVDFSDRLEHLFYLIRTGILEGDDIGLAIHRLLPIRKHTLSEAISGYIRETEATWAPRTSHVYKVWFGQIDAAFGKNCLNELNPRMLLGHRESNERRRHSSLDKQTPDEAYFGKLERLKTGT